MSEDRFREILVEMEENKIELLNQFERIDKKLDTLLADFGNLINVKKYILENGEKSPSIEVRPVKKESTKNLKVTEQTESKLIIEHEGRTYSRFKPCKYKCGMWSSFADDYKKGDRPLHVNPVTKEVLGGCPKYE